MNDWANVYLLGPIITVRSIQSPWMPAGATTVAASAVVTVAATGVPSPNDTIMPVPKPVPLNETTVPPAAGPTLGERVINVGLGHTNDLVGILVFSKSIAAMSEPWRD